MCVTFINLIRLAICKLTCAIRSNSDKKMKIGLTGSIKKMPVLRISRKGKISIGSHCGMEKIELCAADGGMIIIGDYTSLGDGFLAVSRCKICIGEKCSIAPNVSIYDHDHKFNISGITSGYSTENVIIGNNVWIGTGVIILKGTEIGNNCVVGAGTVLQGKVPPNTIIKSKREYTIKKIDWR